MRQALEALVAEMVDKGILFEEARTEFERRFIQRVLAQEGGNRSLAAQALGIHRNTLSRKLDELKIAVPAKKRARAAAAGLNGARR